MCGRLVKRPLAVVERASWRTPGGAAPDCALGRRAGADEADATSARQPAPDFAAGLRPAAELPDRPLAGRRLAVVAETRGAGVAPGVSAAMDRALRHLESLGAEVGEVGVTQGFMVLAVPAVAGRRDG